MDRTVYFSKVSLNSEDVYNLVEDYEMRFEITRNILSMIRHEYKFSEKNTYFTEEGEKREETVSYAISIKEKNDESIHGILDRKAIVFIKERDQLTGEMRNMPVENTEDIEFYYDVLHEYIAYISRRRFKNKMFNDAFSKMLNLCAKENNFEYSFYVETFNSGMTIEEMQNLIKFDSEIKELTITYRPANPDQAIIDAAQEGMEKERLKESNATERSIIYRAKGKSKINGGAKIIQDDLSNLVEMNKDMPILDMTQRGYIVVTSINGAGDVKTTADAKPFVKRTNNMHGFVETAKKGITDILKKVNKFD